MNSRDKILNKIQKAEKAENNYAADYSEIDKEIKDGINTVTPKDRDSLWNQFQKELEIISGEFHSVKNNDEAVKIISEFISENNFSKIGIGKELVCKNLAEPIKQSLPDLKIISTTELNGAWRKKELAVTEVSIVHPSFAVADIGSLVFLYDETGTSLPHFLCDNTFVIIYQDQIVPNQFELFEKLDSEKSKNMVFITGPSRTADIEKVLVLGAHGPRKLIVILIEEK
jgi:L-lactate dehydrogenase complex protein LldG